MKLLLVLNTIFDLVVVITSAFLLDNLLLAGNALGLTTLSALLVNQTKSEVVRPGLIAFAVFHSAITLAWVVIALRESAFNPAAIGHGLFAIAFWVVTYQQMGRQ